MNLFQSEFNPYCHTQRFEQPFSFNKLYSYPGSLSNYNCNSKKRIGIIGGGIAGLTSAYELSQLGNEVELLEASSRLGGRIRTHYFSDKGEISGNPEPGARPVWLFQRSKGT